MQSPSTQLTLVPHAYQGAVIEQRASDGYINATAMCRAAGREWSAYRRLDTTNAYFEALATSLQIHRDLLVQSIVTGDNATRGTWVNPQVAIHLAQWLSPEFAVKVTGWVHDWMLGRDPRDRVWAQFEDRISLTNDTVPDGFWCIFREIADLFAAMISRGVDPGTRLILDISVGKHWANHWRAQGMAATYGEAAEFPHFYPDYFPQARSNPQMATCYPEDALPEFRRWVRTVYTPHKMPEYLRSQVAQKKIPAQLANNAIEALESRAANRALPRPKSAA
ncbi:KilA-N domain-containing protein [Novosphingobium sp.]|uniref:KilA-N domain-containing protein n=1 Tax=Novosphingobium sp. TaxID=1874826 RepID=UPI0038BD9E62